MRVHLLLTLSILAMLNCRSRSETAPPSASKLEAYQASLNTVVENINKASEKSEALIAKHMSAVEKDPGALITKDAMEKLMQSNSLGTQRVGTRSITVESQQGFNGISNYQPSGWKITDVMSGPTEKQQQPAGVTQPVYTYPAGLGPVLLNGCTGTNYTATSPCATSKVLDTLIMCLKQIDAANYIGVGFDGRGYYRSESRRASLIQRACAKKRTFMNQDVPDTMNVFGIFDTMAETKSFQSVDEYMSYIRNKAGLSEQKNLFTSEASKFSKANSFGFNLGGIGSIIGGAIGAVAGGPVAAGMGATLGGAIGGSIGFGTGSGSGSQSGTDKGSSSSRVEQTDQASRDQGSNQNFFAIMYVNVVLYEISLDDVKPTDINLAALKDYMNLPVSYFTAGSDVKYQNYLLRWGTHFIRSAKFGGQLRITKTAKTDKIQSQKEFASIAETEFQSMFATLQSKYTQDSSSWSFLGFGGASSSTSQSSTANSQSGYTGTLAEKNQQSQAYRQSEFTQTTVDAQGGTPEIAEALVDFYTPAFKQLFHTWVVSIKDYAKPFEFQLRPINEMFDLNTDDLFPTGNTDFGCVGDGSRKVEILTDPVTKERYYLDTFTEFSNNVTIQIRKRVNCKYSSIDDFRKTMDKRMVSLERAVAVYMAEGPFPTSSFELQGGEPGCEAATEAQVQFFGNGTVPLKFVELQREPFIVAFNLPDSVPGVLTAQAKFKMVFKMNRWFAIEPTEETMNLYEGCQIANVKQTDQKVCFRNIIMTYEESSGLFYIDQNDFAASKLRIPSLPYWLSGTTVARSSKLETSDVMGTRPEASIPCNVKWLNSHRLDPEKTDNCIHFTAATEGDVFVIFSAIPRDKSTWYYMQVTPVGVTFHHNFKAYKRDTKRGMGVLGDKNLFQSFFVCVIQNPTNVTIQYGKADPDSEVGTVYSAYTFPADVTKSNRLSFYTFGTGSQPVSIMNIRLTKQMPKVTCLDDDYEMVNGACFMVCHAECSGCNDAKNNRGCQQCKNYRVEVGTGVNKVTECIAQCPPGMQPTTGGYLCASCAAGTFKTAAGNSVCTPCSSGTSSPEGSVNCAAICPSDTYKDSTDGRRCVTCPAGERAPAGASGCSGPYEFEPGKALLFTIRAHSGQTALDLFRNKGTNSARPSQGQLADVYRSPLLDNMVDTVTKYKVKRIVAEMRKDGSVVSQAVFDVSTNTAGLTSENWFTVDRLFSTSPYWAGKTGFAVFSISGHRVGNDIRTFYIQYNHGGCDIDKGFMGIGESATDGCRWVTGGGSRPVLFHSTRNDKYSSTVAYADRYFIYFLYDRV